MLPEMITSQLVILRNIVISSYIRDMLALHSGTAFKGHSESRFKSGPQPLNNGHLSTINDNFMCCSVLPRYLSPYRTNNLNTVQIPLWPWLLSCTVHHRPVTLSLLPSIKVIAVTLWSEFPYWLEPTPVELLLPVKAPLHMVTAWPLWRGSTALAE